VLESGSGASEEASEALEWLLQQPFHLQERALRHAAARVHSACGAVLPPTTLRGKVVSDNSDFD